SATSRAFFIFKWHRSFSTSSDRFD
ncbi:putative general secretion pathway D domain protein, partial [Chlamydia psittaci 84-8471/1]